MSNEVLSLKEISKHYSHPVLSQINLSIQQGESLALVGANGFGKSTLIKIILGLVKADSGSGQIMSRALGSSEAYEKIAYLPETPAFWPELNAFDYLRFGGKLKGLPENILSKKIPELLSAVGLLQRGNRPMGDFSKGMLQRAGIALLLLSNPSFIILDEPMSGLDPRAQEKLKQILLHLREQGKTLLISSHALDDIRLLCSRLVVIEKTKLVLDLPTDEGLHKLLQKYKSSEPWDDDPTGDFKNALTF